MDKLYIVIPAYNESENLSDLVNDWYPIVEKHNGDGESRLVIIDDGSKDNTYKSLCSLAESRPFLLPLTKLNGGHGATVLYGYRYAIENGADYVFQTDSDGQTNAAEFEKFWELRKDYKTLDEAIARLILDPQGILKEEPNRLLIDDMRDTVQAQTLLSIIGNGANRISEIAARAGSGASTITEPIGRLRELGLVSREVPYGEEPLKSKKGIYHISDSLLRFIYRFSLPYMSILEIAGTEPVMKIVREQFDNYVSLTWENLCREYVAGRSIDGVAYNAGQRWWGKTIDKKTGKQAGEVEIDVVAVSIDKKSVLIGECKWTENEDADRQMNRLREITPNLPFVKEGQKVEYALFLKRKPKKATVGNIFTPGDILK